MTVGVLFPEPAAPLSAGGGENVGHRVAGQLPLNVRIPPQIPFQRLVERFRRPRAAAFAIGIENDLFCRFVDTAPLVLPRHPRINE